MARSARTLPALWLMLGLLALGATAHAQGFFQHVFGQHNQHAEKEPTTAGDPSWFRERVDAAKCTAYLCPDTLACVPGPAACPCPFAEQTRCAYPSEPTPGRAPDADDAGGYFCVQAHDCHAVRLAQALTHKPSY